MFFPEGRRRRTPLFGPLPRIRRTMGRIDMGRGSCQPECLHGTCQLPSNGLSLFRRRGGTTHRWFSTSKEAQCDEIASFLQFLWELDLDGGRLGSAFWPGSAPISGEIDVYWSPATWNRCRVRGWCLMRRNQHLLAMLYTIYNQWVFKVRHPP